MCDEEHEEGSHTLSVLPAETPSPENVPGPGVEPLLRHDLLFRRTVVVGIVLIAIFLAAWVLRYRFTQTAVRTVMSRKVAQSDFIRLPLTTDGQRLLLWDMG